MAASHIDYKKRGMVNQHAEDIRNETKPSGLKLMKARQPCSCLALFSRNHLISRLNFAFTNVPPFIYNWDRRKKTDHKPW